MNLIKITDYALFLSRGGGNPALLQSEIALAVGGVYLAGGSIRRTFMNKHLDSDFDFFFESEGHKNRFEDKLISQGFALDCPRETVTNCVKDGKKYQSIYYQYYDSAYDLMDSFDYSICQWVIKDGALYTTAEAIADCAKGKLSVHKITYPISSVRRLLKYTGQGFTACNGCLQSLLIGAMDAEKSHLGITEQNYVYVD